MTDSQGPTNGSTHKMEFTLNGAPTKIEVRPDESLLDALRDRCDVISPKDGCQPQGQCGCCLVLVDGKPRVSCAAPAEKSAGKSITTLEGLEPLDRKRIADAFVAAAGLQCGFCIPGMALRAKALLDANPSPTRAEVAKAIDIHLCRCTGYTKILDAFELMAKAWRGEGEPQITTAGGVGDSLGKYDGVDLAMGDRPYVADIQMPGMLHGAVKLSDHARAKIVKIDTRKAMALDGVEAVVTAADVPGERWYGLILKDWPGFVAQGEEARYVGDVLAAVAAVDRTTARRAVDLIEVQYEVLDAVLDAESSLKPGAPQVNPKHPNELSRTVIQRGDADAALNASAHVVSGTWETQRIEHMFLEPESAIAAPMEGGSIRLLSQGQGVFDDRRQVADFLGLPQEKIFVELVPNGGAFGGKEDMSVQSQTALLCFKVGKPVKLTLSREESIRLHPKRHPIKMEYTVGCDADGLLTAVKARIVGDSGAYASVGAKVMERAAGHSCGPYKVPAVDVVSVGAYTNNPPCGAMRGFGANQAHFAMEGCMDALANKAGIDAWEIRWRNAVEVGSQVSSGQILEKSVGLKRCLAAVKDPYYAAVKSGKAVGIGCGIKNSGIGNGAEEWGKSRLVVEDDGTVTIYNGYTEMGQGLLTVLVQFAVEVTGLAPDLFRVKVNSTFELGSGQTTGSRATLLGGRAVVAAAIKLRAQLDAGKQLKDLVGQVYQGDVVIDDTNAPGKSKTGKEKTHTSYGYAAQVCILDENGRVDRFLAAHDVGRAVNPALCEGQIEGSVHMGLGYALTEELPCDNGMPVTFKLKEIGVLRARDMPDVDVILVEDAEPEGPFGAKGVGEIGLVPTAGAVAGALEAFDGIRRYTLPMKDSPAARAMSVGKIRPKRNGK